MIVTSKSSSCAIRASDCPTWPPPAINQRRARLKQLAVCLRTFVCLIVELKLDRQTGLKIIRDLLETRGFPCSFEDLHLNQLRPAADQPIVPA